MKDYNGMKSFKNTGYRDLVTKSYLVFCVLGRKTVEIGCIIHSSRK